MKRTPFALLILFAVITVGGYAQEKPTVPVDRLIATHTEAKSIAESALALRSRLSKDLSATDFVREVNGLMTRCAPIIVLIAETNPPKEAQRFAMNVAMGIKGVELALWYYTYGVLSNQSDYMNSGDQFLNRGVQELKVAESLLGR